MKHNSHHSHVGVASIGVDGGGHGHGHGGGEDQKKALTDHDDFLFSTEFPDLTDLLAP